MKLGLVSDGSSAARILRERDSPRGPRNRLACTLHIDVERRFELWYERLTLPRAVATVISVAFVLVMVAGALARIVEPDVFTSLGLAYWWAVVTVTTVGYGDVVPESPAGRIVGTMLMLTGLGLIPTLTSVTVAILVGKRTQRATGAARPAGQGARGGARADRSAPRPSSAQARPAAPEGEARLRNERRDARAEP